ASLDKIRASDPSLAIETLDKMHLFFFLLFLHWRLPSNIPYVDELSKQFFTEGSDNFGYFFLKSKKGEVVPKEMKDKIRDSSAFKKAAKLMIPFAPFYEKNWSQKMENWRFLYTKEDESWYLVGDNPIITNGQADHDPINCLNEFVFPVSGNILLVNTQTPLKHGTPPEFIIQYNIAVMEKSARFVACPRRDFLETLVGYYKHLVQTGMNGLVIDKMFAMLDSATK
ncbi:MAG: DUF4238 domain-containing protein, partial [bacterium]|nr:DUF4238 domain-containing protein [bacterium]